MRKLIATITLALVLIPAAASRAGPDDERLESWPQFRGPTADGCAAEASPPTTWSERKNVRWKVEIPGRGLSTPIVWGDRIFVLSAIATGADPLSPSQPFEFVVVCLDRKTGKTIWRRVAVEVTPLEGIHKTASYATPTPVTDGKHVYASFGSRGIFCFDLDGNPKWKRDLGDKTIRRRFGEGTSIVLHGDALVQLWDHEGQSSIHCLDAATGESRWSVDRTEATTWNTPLIVEHEGVTQVIANGRRVRSYDLATGKVLWELGGEKRRNPIPAPVTRDGVVYLATGAKGAAVTAIPLSARGKLTARDALWQGGAAGPELASPLLYGDKLYLTKDRTSTLSVLDIATGKAHYEGARVPGVKSMYASLAGGGGKVFITGRSGTTVVVEHGTSFKILATNTLGEPIDSSPVLVGDELFLRGRRHLYCISEGAGAGKARPRVSGPY